MHAAVVNYLANQRQGTQSTLTRTEVSGGGIKPWRQKGTGRARAGSIRSPLWVGGGIAHGPKPRDYSFSINKKERKIALSSAISTRQAANRIFIIDEIRFDSIKTKQAVEVLAKVGINPTETTLLVLSGINEIVQKSFRNIAGIKVLPAEGLNVYDILSRKNLVFVGDALDKVVARLG